MTIRFATKEDGLKVLAVLDELFALGYTLRKEEVKIPPNTNERLVMFEKLLDGDDTSVFVAEEKGKIVGVVDLYLFPNMGRGEVRAKIEHFVVTENMRGKGVGTKLFTAVKKYCQEKGVKVLKLTSGVELKEAHRFYEKNGGRFTEKMFRFEL
jgi:GNAT superfamily N-acetyltransferase